MAKKKKILETIDTLNLDDLIEHYLQMRFSVWDGSQYYQKQQWSVYEWLPVKEGEPENKTKKQTRFDSKKEALEFIEFKREQLRVQLYNFFELELPKIKQKIKESDSEVNISDIPTKEEPF